MYLSGVMFNFWGTDGIGFGYIFDALWDCCGMEVVDGDTDSGGSGGGGGIYLSGELWICDIVFVISFLSWEWKGIFGMYAEE